MAIDKTTIINSREEKERRSKVKSMKYSENHQTMFDRRYDEQQVDDGPIAGRTRSRTEGAQSRSPPNAEGNESDDNPLAYTNIRGTPPQPRIPRHSTGAIVKRHASNLALQRSDRKLRNTREKVRKHIATNERFRDRYGQLRNRYYERLYMLGTRTPDGSLGRMPRPLRARDCKTPEELEKESKENEVGKSKNWEMNKYWTIEELEKEFGIIPGYDRHLRDEELDREDYLDMQAYKKRRERFIDFIARGDPVEGVWERVLELDDGKLVMLRRWLIEEVMQLRNLSGDTAVMDERCVAIVRRVLVMIEVAQSR